MVTITLGEQEKIPQLSEKEAWLYQNEEALTKVLQGLTEAHRGEFSETTPDIEGNLEWLEDVDDDPDEWIDC
jgi:hypothetical protein